MKKNNIEEQLFKAFADAVPDQRDEIVRKASSRKTPGALMSIDQVNYRRKYIHYFTAAAAVLVLIAGIILSVVVSRNNEVFGTVTVEGAECYEIELNRASRPLAINGCDSAAKHSAQLIRKEYDTLGEAVDCVLDTMLDTGSLNEDCNTVLITVSFDDRSEEQLRIALDAAKQSFIDSGFDGAILGTVASKDKEVLSISRHNTVSVGKAEMVRDILAVRDSVSTAALCRLSINDLNLFSIYYRVPYDTISVYGMSHGSITPEEAVQLALSYIGDPKAAAEVILDVDENGLIYAVTVRGAQGDDTFLLSAATGEIVVYDAPGGTEKATESVSPTPPPTPPPIQPTESDRTQKPTEGRNSPTQTVPPTASPQPTTAPAPTTPPTQPEPEIFTRSMYYRYTAGVYGEEILPATAKEIAVRRVYNGYDIYYDDATFPYSAQGVQGGITAMVFNTDQFRALTGTDDDRFDDAYFATHALYIYMNRDVQYHWTKSINSAYIDGSTLYLENAEAIGRYVGDQDTKIHTVIYELNKDDLRSFTSMLEFE